MVAALFRFSGNIGISGGGVSFYFKRRAAFDLTRLFTASIAGNYQIAAITALVLLVPSVVFMLFIERFLKADVLSKIGA